MDSKNGVILLGFLGLAGILLFLATRRPATYQPVPVRSQPLRLSHHVPAEGMLHYKNKETRKIDWNEEGLPVVVTIEREYYQLP